MAKPSPPGKPTFTNTTLTTVTVSWAASTSTGGKPIKAYLMRRWNAASMLYSAAVLVPLFVVVTALFFSSAS